MIKNAYDYALHSGAINPNIVKSLDEANNSILKFTEREKTITENGRYSTIQNDYYDFIKYNSSFTGERISTVIKDSSGQEYSVDFMLIDQQLPQLNSKEDLIQYVLDNNFMLFTKDGSGFINQEILNEVWPNAWAEMDTRPIDGIIHGGVYSSCIVYDWKKAKEYNKESPFTKNGIYLSDIETLTGGYAYIGRGIKIDGPVLYNPVIVNNIGKPIIIDDEWDMDNILYDATPESVGTYYKYIGVDGKYKNNKVYELVNGGN